MLKEPNNFYITDHYVCKYKDGFIYMDVNTLDVFIIEEIDSNIIKAIKKYPIDEALNLLSVKYSKQIIAEHIAELQKNGILRKAEDKNEKEATIFNYDPDIITSIDVILSEDCNLACKYCFVKKNKYNGKSALLQSDVGEKIINFLIQKSGNKNDVFICFFGGEPLMNFMVMEKMVLYALEEGRKNNKCFHFSLTTNGTLLNDEIVEFICKHQISVLISIDGDMHSHNLNRPLSGGGDSYNMIEENVRKLARKNISYSARTTITSYTKNNIAKNFEHLISLGFKGIHFENAMAPKGKVFINKKDDIREIKKQYSLISKKISKSIKLGQPYNVESFPLPMGKIVSKRPDFFSCTAGRGYLSADVNGDLYLCHRFVGEKSFTLGNVSENTYSAKLSEIMKPEMNIDNRKKCKKCWARYICGGGCYEINNTFNNNIFITPEIYCQLMKHNIKLALNIYASASE